MAFASSLSDSGRSRSVTQSSSRTLRCHNAVSSLLCPGKSQQGNIYLNLGAAFPKQTFSGFIRSRDAEKIGDAKKFEGKTVAITGKIETYNDKAQIVISAPDQIKVIEEAAPAEPVKP